MSSINTFSYKAQYTVQKSERKTTIYIHICIHQLIFCFPKIDLKKKKILSSFSQK